MSKPTLALISIDDGHDAAAAKELLRLYGEAQQAGVKIMRLGLAAWEIKETKLKHGQFGPWLAAHCPALVRPDAKTGKPKPSSGLSSFMQMTKDVLEDMGFTIEKYFKHIAKFPSQLGICYGGKFLALPEKKAKKLPDEAAKLRSAILERVQNKTAKQIRWAFGQVEENEAGEVKTKVGRTKGQGGNSKETLAAAKADKAAIEAAEAKFEAEEAAKALIKAIEENCDTAHLGTINDELLARVAEAKNLLDDFISPLIKARKIALRKQFMREQSLPVTGSNIPPTEVN